jgi:hypothetical protein
MVTESGNDYTRRIACLEYGGLGVDLMRNIINEYLYLVGRDGGCDLGTKNL